MPVDLDRVKLLLAKFNDAATTEGEKHGIALALAKTLTRVGTDGLGGVTPAPSRAEQRAERRLVCGICGSLVNGVGACERCRLDMRRKQTEIRELETILRNVRQDRDTFRIARDTLLEEITTLKREALGDLFQSTARRKIRAELYRQLGWWGFFAATRYVSDITHTPMRGFLEDQMSFRQGGFGARAGSIWSGMKDARVKQSGTYLTEGQYHVRIGRMAPPEPHPVSNELLLFTDLEILASSDPTQHPVGSTRQWCQKLVDPKMYLPAVKGFLFAAWGLDVVLNASLIQEQIEPVLDEIMDFYISEHNPMIGLDLGVECTQITTKKGTEFTRHDWFATAPDGDQARRVNLILTGFRSALGGRPPAASYGAPPAAYGPPPGGYAAPGYGAPPPAAAPPAPARHVDPATGRVALYINGGWVWQ